jgi:hypothetical protein
MTWVGTAIAREAAKRPMAAVSFILTMRLGGIDRVCDVGQLMLRDGRLRGSPTMILRLGQMVLGVSRRHKAQS